MRFTRFAALPCAAAMVFVAVPMEPDFVQAEGTEDVAICISSAEVTMEQLEAADYQVPLMVMVEQNTGIMVMELAIQSDLEYTVYNHPKKFSITCSELATADPGVNYELDGVMSFGESWDMPGITKCTWASADADPNLKTFLGLVAKVPIDAQPGDEYLVHLVAEHPSGWHCVVQKKDNGIVTDYVADNKVTLVDGYIRIVGEEETTEPAEEIVLGDLDGSGSVDIMDVILVNKYLLGSASFTDADRAAADVDGNGEVDSTDSLNILKRVVEIITSFDSLS